MAFRLGIACMVELRFRPKGIEHPEHAPARKAPCVKLQPRGQRQLLPLERGEQLDQHLKVKLPPQRSLGLIFSLVHFAKKASATPADKTG